MPIRSLVIASLSLLSLFAGAQTVAAGKEDIFTEAPFPSAHASTVVELKNGDVLSAWFGGTAEGKPDVAIYAARRTAQGWSAPVEMVREPGVPCWNPVLFHTHDGRLWLYYKFGPEITGWTGGRLYSTDEGKTWSKPEHLPAGLLGPIRAKPFVAKDGTIVAGSSVESYLSWAGWIERSTDNAKTWTKYGPLTIAPTQERKGKPEPSGIIQPSVIGMGGRHLRLYARSTTDIGHIVAADSNDNGATWGPVHALELRNPNSGIDAAHLRDGRIVMIYNDTPKGRTPLNLAVSKDGEHFTNFLTLEDEPGEYSYPALIQAANGDLLMTYTWHRKHIRYMRLPLAKVPQAH